MQLCKFCAINSNWWLTLQAGIIAFTSDFIQKSMYEYTDVKQDTGQSYIEWSLSTFRTSDFDNESMPIPAFENATFGDTIYANHVCRSVKIFIDNCLHVLGMSVFLTVMH